MDRAQAIFVDGIGAAAATSGILTQLQGRIFALLYLEPDPLSLDEIATELQQSKSNVSVNVRGLVDWHLVRLASVPGSRRDHYQAATNFWRVMQEIMERRFRWNLRQVLATVEETQRAAGEAATRRRRGADDFVRQRLDALLAFATAVDSGIEAFARGQSMDADPMHRALQVVPINPTREA
ncbi:MAG TPA: MarR family transcriptional regulator [Actinomycetota bacterium]|nr:MarR family transcriptional regulator [Actinomycetota bacterium]